MQRWIVAGVAAMMLLLGGGGFAAWTYRQNRPRPIWIPLPVNRELPEEKQSAIARELAAHLEKQDLLMRITRDLGLAEKLAAASDEEAARDLGKRLWVKVGEADSPMGKVPSINIGFSGIAREKKVSEEIVNRLVQEVMKVPGMKPPPPREF